MEPNQFWSLLARKLAGEATSRDLYELEKLVFENPELRFWQRLVRELWNNREAIEKEPGGEEKFIQILQQAYRQEYFHLATKSRKKQNRFCIFSIDTVSEFVFLQFGNDRMIINARRSLFMGYYY